MKPAVMQLAATPGRAALGFSKCSPAPARRILAVSALHKAARPADRRSTVPASSKPTRKQQQQQQPRTPPKQRRAPAKQQKQQQEQQPSEQPRQGFKPRGTVGSTSGSAVAAAAALSLLLPLAGPGAAIAVMDTSANTGPMYWTCIGLGASGIVSTLHFTSRFLMSFFPGLERRARGGNIAGVLRALTATDPLLDPITKGVFKQTEQGDLNYGAMALLASISAVLTILLGHEGLLVDKVPDLTLLWALQYIVYFQHMSLLPMWVIVVFRYFMLI